MKLNTAVASLELKEDELETEIQELTHALAKLMEDLKEATEFRKEEKEQNMDTISKGKEGLTAVTEAIIILKTFYSQSAKALALAQASPEDLDTSGPGFEGNYGGKRQASKGIIGLLEVIKTDFQRTVKVTAEEEQKAAAQFVEFERNAKTDISGKMKKKELDEEDLKTTKATIAEKMSDMEIAQSLLDAALKKIEGLKGMCIDFGMPYKDRVAKRE